MFLLIKNLFILIHRKIMTYTLEEISTILKNEDKNAKILPIVVIIFGVILNLCIILETGSQRYWIIKLSTGDSKLDGTFDI